MDEQTARKWATDTAETTGQIVRALAAKVARDRYGDAEGGKFLDELDRRLAAVADAFEGRGA